MRWVLVGLVGLCLGCGGKSPLDARTELADLGIAYTVKAFFQSAIKGDLTVVKVFVDAGMSVHIEDDEEGFTVLHLAALGGHLAVVRYLVKQGADVNAKTESGMTPLLWAYLGVWVVPGTVTLTGTDTPISLGTEHLAIVRYLVKQGADDALTTEAGALAMVLALPLMQEE